MFANSFVIIVLIIVTGVPALIFLMWAVLNGQFEHIDASADQIFDDEEMRYSRPWETAGQQSARVSTHGLPIQDPWNDWKKWL
jgi:cbb3-type cytochrome oxidase maturation protein